jgi:hypothetical protein
LTENSGSSTSSSRSYGTLGRAAGAAAATASGGRGGMVSMMDEMVKTLARRRAVVDKQDTPLRNNVVVGQVNKVCLNKVLILLFQDGDGDKKPWEKNNSSKLSGSACCLPRAPAYSTSIGTETSTASSSSKCLAINFCISYSD